MLRTKPTLPTKPIEQYYVVLQYLSPVVELVYPSDLKSRVTVNHAPDCKSVHLKNKRRNQMVLQTIMSVSDVDHWGHAESATLAVLR
jgi:hypothetical protein